MDIARLTGHLPAHRALIGIQYQTFGWGEQPTRAIQHNIPLAGRLAANVLLQWEFEAHPPCRPLRQTPTLEIAT
jgi:hydrogenase maturation protease